VGTATKATEATAATEATEARAAAEADPLCVAYNTLGWLKASLTFPLSKSLKGTHGLYVKRGLSVKPVLEVDCKDHNNCEKNVLTFQV
jgi:hypothetical protein